MTSARASRTTGRALDRKSGVEGKRGDLGGGRIIKKKTIDGATAESYVKYRRRGDFDKAIRNLRFAVDEKRAGGRDIPFINWRYILFTHNDSEGEMQRA